jgi:hypothetical protein
LKLKQKKKESRRFTVNSGGPSTSLVFVKNENVKFVLASFTNTLCACIQVNLLVLAGRFIVMWLSWVWRMALIFALII